GGCGESNEKPLDGFTGAVFPVSVENGDVVGVPNGACCFSSSNVNPQSLACAEPRAAGAGPSTTKDCAGADACPLACSSRPSAGGSGSGGRTLSTSVRGGAELAAPVRCSAC